MRAVSASWMNFQEQDDLLQQLFWQSNANSKGQEAYFTQGPPRRGSSIIKEALNVRFSANGVTKLECNLFRRFGTVWRWLQEGNSSWHGWKEATFSREDVSPWDVTSPPKASFLPPNSRVTGPVPATQCFPSSLQTEDQLGRRLEGKES